jgi:N-acetylglutamate synthase-like GNAT family acetyltransferase
VNLRDAEQRDFAAVRRLLGQLGYAPDEAEFRRRFDSVMAAAGHRIIVAEEDGAVAGVLHVFERPALDKGCEAVIQALVVDDAMRGRGVGEALMRETETWASGRGLGAISLYTNVSRDRPAPSTSASATGSRRRLI